MLADLGEGHSDGVVGLSAEALERREFAAHAQVDPRIDQRAPAQPLHPDQQVLDGDRGRDELARRLDALRVGPEGPRLGIAFPTLLLLYGFSPWSLVGSFSESPSSEICLLYLSKSFFLLISLGAVPVHLT